MRTKDYIIDPDHLTKVAAIPIDGKNSLKIFFSTTINQMTLKLGTQQRGPKSFKSYINDDPDDLDLFYNKQQVQLCLFRLLKWKILENKKYIIKV